MKSLSFITIVTALFCFNSCSRTPIGTQRDPAPQTSVSNQELLELSQKYAQLEKEYEQLKSQINPQSQPQPQEDVSVPEVQTFQTELHGSEISSEINTLKEAILKIKNNEMDLAMVLLKKLEASASRQIQVRAKFYLGEILFQSKEYDLALQTYEQIVENYAFSGAILKTIGRIIACSEKLNLVEKKEKYYSVLNDFFGENSI